MKYHARSATDATIFVLLCNTIVGKLSVSLLISNAINVFFVDIYLDAVISMQYYCYIPIAIPISENIVQK